MLLLVVGVLFSFFFMFLLCVVVVVDACWLLVFCRSLCAFVGCCSLFVFCCVFWFVDRRVFFLFSPLFFVCVF